MVGCLPFNKTIEVLGYKLGFIDKEGFLMLMDLRDREMVTILNKKLDYKPKNSQVNS